MNLNRVAASGPDGTRWDFGTSILELGKLVEGLSFTRSKYTDLK
jgi:hypothetical protein